MRTEWEYTDLTMLVTLRVGSGGALQLGVAYDTEPHRSFTIQVPDEEAPALAAAVLRAAGHPVPRGLWELPTEPGTPVEAAGQIWCRHPHAWCSTRGLLLTDEQMRRLDWVRLVPEDES